MHVLTHPTVRPRLLVVGALVACALAVWFVAAPRGHSASLGAPVSVAGVAASTVSADGLELTAPQTAAPNPGASAAAAAVSQAFGRRKVLGEKYAYCVEPGYVPAIGQDCWVVALDPGGMSTNPPAGGASRAMTYFFVLVDPATDKVLGGQAAAD